MGIRIGIRIGLGSSGGGWNPKRLGSKILYWGKISEISSGEMPNKVGTDHLDVAGSAGTYTFQCPNTAPYQNADTDYIWFYLPGQRTPTEAELIGYDFERTIVKYDNVSPYSIREIMILKVGEILTTAEENSMRDYFDLSLWWNGVLSIYGNLKGNRGAGRSVWNPSIILAEAIHYWRMSQATGNLLDAIGTSHGVPSGVTQNIDGKLGKACQFVNTSKGFINCGAISVSAANYIMGWAKRDNLADVRFLCSIKATGFSGIAVYDNGNIDLINAAGTAIASWTSVWTDESGFHHIALLTNAIGAGSSAELYFDGVSKGVKSPITTESISAFTIGALNNSYWFDGIIGPVGLYVGTGNVYKVTEDYNSGVGKYLI